MAVGMADIQLSHNALASEVIIIFNDLSVDHYQDSRIAEIDRIKKLAVFRKVEDLEFVPDDENETLLDDKEAAIPYEVLTTMTWLPRIPRRDDMLLHEGNLYTIHHVKPMNRDIDGLIQLVVYPERTTFIDTLHVYKLIYLDGDTLRPIRNLKEYLEIIPEKDIVLDITWGGNPTEYSFDGKTWLPFQSRIRFNLSERSTHKLLFLKGGLEMTQNILFEGCSV
jgi:hypothetical protein